MDQDLVQLCMDAEAAKKKWRASSTTSHTEANNANYLQGVHLQSQPPLLITNDFHHHPSVSSVFYSPRS